MSANTRLDCLGDLVGHKANLRVRCRCGAEHVFDAERLRRYALIRGWNTQLGALGHHIRCKTCRRRGPYLSVTPERPTPADPFPRNEQGWQAIAKRLRS